MCGIQRGQSALHFLHKTVQFECLFLCTKALVYRVPTTVLFWQPPPFAAVFTDVQDCVDEYEVYNRYITALHWQCMLDFFVLLHFYLHAKNISYFVIF